MKIKDARSISPEAQEELRIRTVNAVLNGMTQTEAAKVFGVSRRAVVKWIRVYKKGGSQALERRKKGSRKGGKIQPEHAEQIKNIVKNNCPDALGLPYYLWTRQAVADLVFKLFGIRLSKWQIGRYLKRWGFTPQKPAKKAYEKDQNAVTNWIEKEYHTICKKADEENAVIYWGDEMGVRSDNTSGTSYAPAGQTPVISTTGRRFSCNLIAGIASQGILKFMIFKHHFDADIFLEFLNRLILQNNQKIFLIVDRHPVHRSRKVSQWIEKHADKIELFLLPGYSPELNPDEMLNQDVKSNAIGRKRPRSFKELVSNLRRYLLNRQRRPEIIKNYFKKKTVAYAS